MDMLSKIKNKGFKGSILLPMIIAFIFGITIIQNGCSKPKTSANPLFTIKTTSLSGTVVLPAGTPNINLSNLVVSSFVGSTKVNSDGSFNVQAVVGPGNQVLMLTDTTTGNLVMMGYVPSQTTTGVTISAGSTANAMIGLNPILMGYDFTQRAQIFQLAYSQSEYPKLIQDIATALVNSGEQALNINTNPQLYIEARYIAYRAVNSYYNQITITTTNYVALYNALTPWSSVISNTNGNGPYIGIGNSSGSIIVYNPKAIYYGAQITDQYGNTQLHLISAKPGLIWGCQWGVICQTGPYSTEINDLSNANYTAVFEKGFNTNQLNTLFDPTTINGLATTSNIYNLISEAVSLFAGINLPDLTDEDIHNPAGLLAGFALAVGKKMTDTVVSQVADDVDTISFLENFINALSQDPDSLISWLIQVANNQITSDVSDFIKDVLKQIGEDLFGVGDLATIAKATNTVAPTVWDLFTAPGYLSASFQIDNGLTTVTPKISSVTVVPSSVSIDVGQTITLQATVYDANGDVIATSTDGTNCTIFGWESDNRSIAEVSLSGTITGEGVGTAHIIVYGGAITTVATVNVTPLPTSNTPPLFAGLSSIKLNSDNSITLSWSSASDASTAPQSIVYLIYQATTVGGENYNTPTYTTTPGVLSYTIPSGYLTSNTTYFFVVRAKNLGGLTDSNTYELYVKTGSISTTPPSSPTGLSASAGNGQVTLNWSASSGATSYNVYDSTTSGGPYTKVGTTSNTNYTVTGLTNGTTYYFVVTAVNSVGESGYSNQVNGTPQSAVSTTGWTDGFETYTANTWPSIWIPDGNATDNSTNYIDNTVAHSGSQSLHMMGILGSCWEALAYRSLTVSPPYTVQVTVRPGNESLTSGCHQYRARIGIRQGTSWTNPDRSFLFFANDGTIRAGDATSTNPPNGTILGTYTPLTWYSITITYTTTSSTVQLSYTINGSYITTITLPISSNEGQFTNLELISGDDTAWYDDVSVTSQAAVAPAGTEFTYTVGTNPLGIAIDASGNVWIANGGNNTVTKLNSNGITVGTYIITTTTIPWSIAIDSGGNVWVSGGMNGASTITELSPTGNVLGNYPVSQPEGVAIDQSGNIWVADKDLNYTTNIDLTKLSNTGSVLATYQTNGNGGVNNTYVAIDSSGNIWVESWWDSNVLKLTSTGSIIGTYSAGPWPSGQLAIDQSGNVWIPNTGSCCGNYATLYNTVTELSSNGITIGTYTVPGYNLHDIAIDSAGHVWVTLNATSSSGSTANQGNTIAELASNGSVIQVYTVGHGPSGIAIDAFGNVWVSNTADNTVTKIVGVAKGPQYFPYTGPQWP